MQSVFLRIYGGMLVAVVANFLLLYFSYQWLNQYRLKNYLNDTANGAFKLIAQGLGRYQEKRSQDWLDVLEKLTDLDLVIVSELPSDLSSGEISRLKKGELIVRIDPEQRVALIYIAIPGKESQFLKTNLNNINEQISRTMALLVINELRRSPKHLQSNALEKLQSYFGFPVDIQTLQQISLDFSQQRRLKRGDVVVVLNDANTNNPFIQVYAKYDDQGLVLTLGPIPLFNWYPVELMSLFFAIGIISLAICGFMLVRPLERRLQLLEVEVEKIGTDLTPSMLLKGDDIIARFSSKLNAMTARINNLLNEQRDLVHAISHELRTPVARLRFRLAKLREANSRKLQIGVIDDVEKDINELNQLIDEILTYASLENDLNEVPKRKIDIESLIGQVLDGIKPLHTELAFSIVTDRSDVSVFAIEYLMRRALENLVVNATRYARQNIVVEFSSIDNIYCLQVADDGPGIAVEEREKIFIPFKRLDKSRARESGGFGLGLAIVQQIARLHSGSVTVSSSEYGGALFSLCWPLDPDKSQLIQMHNIPKHY